MPFYDRLSAGVRSDAVPDRGNILSVIQAAPRRRVRRLEAVQFILSAIHSAPLKQLHGNTPPPHCKAPQKKRLAARKIEETRNSSSTAKFSGTFFLRPHLAMRPPRCVVKDAASGGLHCGRLGERRSKPGLLLKFPGTIQPCRVTRGGIPCSGLGQNPVFNRMEGTDWPLKGKP